MLLLYRGLGRLTSRVPSPRLGPAAGLDGDVRAQGIELPTVFTSVPWAAPRQLLANVQRTAPTGTTGAPLARKVPIMIGTATFTSVVNTSAPTPKTPMATIHSTAEGRYS